MENLRGIMLMTISMAGFALEDMFVKLMAADLPTGQILLMLGVTGAIVFAAMAAFGGQSVWSRDAWARPVVLRNLGDVVGTFGFVTALALIPIALVSAVLQAMPLAVTCGAALFMGEKVGWRRWSAIVVGFVGVLIVIRPGLEGFRPPALWVVLSVVALSLRDLATRRIPSAISTMQVGAWAFISVAALGAAMLVHSGGAAWPTLLQSAYMFGALAFGIAAYWAITSAMRVGEMSVITPFRYSRLIFAIIIGMVVFGERPDALMLLGSAVIIGSGLYTLSRERKSRRDALSLAVVAR
jgi:drug/metabolite transporter (DMT)-like permease